VLQLEPDEELRLVAGRTMMTFRAGDVLGRFTTEVTELAAYLSAQTSTDQLQQKTSFFTI